MPWPPDWKWRGEYLALFTKLAFQHGEERARAIAAGEDDETNEDLAAWRRCTGRRYHMGVL